MHINDWKKEVFTIPNLLSVFRLALIPVYARIYLNASSDSEYTLAGIILALSSLTDLADGRIARRFQMVSTLGKILDPLADKLTQFVLTLCLSLRHPELWYLLALFIVKELFQLVMGIISLLHGQMLTGALAEGKVCTTVLFLSLIALVLFPGLSPQAVQAIVTADSLFLLISFASYIRAYFGENPPMQNL